MLSFTKSCVDTFKHVNKSQRYGQAFYSYMKLDKVCERQDKDFCNRLYNADDAKAKAMIQSRIDQNN